MIVDFLTMQDVEVGVRLLVAAVLGGFIGLERESSGKEAGFRTHALVGLGSALIMVVSMQVYDIYKDASQVDPSRIAAQVVSGIGFLGAGAIIRSSEKIKGLTTAAGIWTAAGIGLACGLGLFRPAIITTVLALVILVYFSRFSTFLGKEGKKK